MSDTLLFRYLDAVPISVVFLLTTLALFLVCEMGFRVSRHWREGREQGHERTSVLVGATLSLLAFMLSFSFGMANTRFDARIQTTVNEANAIGTAWLRSQMMPPAHAEQISTLLQRYVEIRMAGTEVKDITGLKEVLDNSVKIHDELWKHAVVLGKQYPQSMPVRLFIDSLNTMIDLHELRLAVLENRLARGVIMTLYTLALTASLMIGIDAGFFGRRSTSLIALLCIVFSMVMVLIIDLDRPDQTLFRVSQQPFADLLEGMRGSG